MLLQSQIIPVTVLERVEDAPYVAEALLKGGISIMEITFRTDAAHEAMVRIGKEFPDMTLGAGTVLTVDQVEKAYDAGAKFGVAPGCTEAVVRAAQQKELVFVPGVLTPSDIERALNLGCTLLKFFPAEAAGGTMMLKALGGPYKSSGIQFIPTGGIKAENAVSYLRMPIVAAVGASWIVDKKIVAEKNWSEITKRSTQFLQLVHAI
jgi:2-dehydro-3-deoxyphosphogluconate aldolase / (4S)-4-hydroxy-2-oxoglutarate aldolase